MLLWTVVFLVIALLAGLFGFFGIVGGVEYILIAKMFFFIFIILFIWSLFLGRRSF